MNSISPQYIFVYGTLRRDTRHEMYRLLARHAQFMGDATFRGRLYLVDDYPGAVASSSPGDQVRGEVYLLLHPDDVLPKLDEYEEFDPQSPETSLYRRDTAEVVLDDGSRLLSWVYLYNKPTTELSRIASGDFLKAASSR
ncbi:MAG: gamma-glutamylcyclotransferase family protein [Planctomycetales bacterium]